MNTLKHSIQGHIKFCKHRTTVIMCIYISERMNHIFSQTKMKPYVCICVCTNIVAFSVVWILHIRYMFGSIYVILKLLSTLYYADIHVK